MVGVDDFFGTWFTPSLSTLAQRFESLGDVAADLVTEVLGGGEPRDLRIEPHLIVRESSAGVRA